MDRRTLIQGVAASSMVKPVKEDTTLKSDTYYRTFWGVHNTILDMKFKPTDAMDAKNFKNDLVLALRDMASRIEGSIIEFDTVGIRFDKK